MEGSKLKNIVLIILAVANLFLLVLTVTREEQSARYQRSARINAIAVLAENGIALDAAILPEDTGLAPLIMERDRQVETQAASALLGTALESAQGTSSIYVGDNGILRFSRTGEFSASLEPGAAPVGGLTEEKHALGVLKILDFSSGALTAETKGAVTLVTAPQLWQGSPVFNCRAVLMYEAGSFVGIRGGDSVRLTGKPVVAGQVRNMSVVTALMRFLDGINQLGDVCTGLTGIAPGYVFSPGFSDPVELEPVWRITTDTGAYYLYADSGKLERAG